MEKFNSETLPQLLDSGVSQEELYNLFVDLSLVFRNPFDDAINDAIKTRGATYVEQVQVRSS